MPSIFGPSFYTATISSKALSRHTRLSLGSAAVALLLVTGCGSKPDAADTKGNDTAVVTATPALAPPAETDSIQMPPGPKSGPLTADMQGIGLSRAEIARGLGEDFLFEVGEPIEGREAAIGEGGETYVLIIGPADNPVHASYFAPILEDTVSDPKVMSSLRSYVRTINPAAAQWVDSSVASALKGKTPVTETRTFGNHNIEFVYGLYRGYTTTGYITLTVTRS